jgi:hypothetical protein
MWLWAVVVVVAEVCQGIRYLDKNDNVACHVTFTG